MGGTSVTDVRRALESRPPRHVPGFTGTHSAVSLILREAGTGLELLFIHRAEHPDAPTPNPFCRRRGVAEAFGDAP